MLKKLQVKNFKAFSSLNIEIKPITILIGPNNGGKSSILQSVEILKQTISSNTNDLLLFNGDIDFGEYKVIHHQYVDEKLKKENDFIEFKCVFDDDTYFDTIIRGEGKHVDISDYSCYNGRFGLNFENIRNVDNKYLFDVHFTIEDIDLKPIDEYLKEATIYKKNFLCGVNYSVQHTEKIESLFEEVVDIILRARENKVKKSTKRVRVDDLIKIMDSLFQIQNESSEFNDDIRLKFKNIRYVGPLRDTAKRYYMIDKYKSVGYKGEYAVQMIAGDDQLFKKTKDALKEIKVIDDIYIDKTNLDKNIIELRLIGQNTAKDVNFADVGCGVSQLLPLLVEYLSVDGPSLTIMEQPETHINPGIQQEFVDYLVRNMNNDKSKKVIIETHSEYILERIKTWIAASVTNPDSKYTLSPEDIKIYYVDQNKDLKESYIQEIIINMDGTYSNVPDDYPTNFLIRDTKRQVKLKIERMEKMNDCKT